jgi:hypothetical protein
MPATPTPSAKAIQLALSGADKSKITLETAECEQRDCRNCATMLHLAVRDPHHPLGWSSVFRVDFIAHMCKDMYPTCKDCLHDYSDEFDGIPWCACDPVYGAEVRAKARLARYRTYRLIIVPRLRAIFRTASTYLMALSRESRTSHAAARVRDTPVLARRVAAFL